MAVILQLPLTGLAGSGVSLHELGNTAGTLSCVQAMFQSGSALLQQCGQRGQAGTQEVWLPELLARLLDTKGQLGVENEHRPDHLNTSRMAGSQIGGGNGVPFGLCPVTPSQTSHGR